MKTFIRGILTTILIVTFTLIPTIIFAERVVTEDLIGKYTKQEVTKQIVETVRSEETIPEEKIKALEESLQNDETTQKVIEKYIDKVIKDLSSQDIEDVNVEEDIKSIIKENRKEFEGVLGIELTDEKIDQVIEEVSEDYDLNESYKQIIQETKEEMPTESKVLFTSYNSITSTEFIIAMIITTIIAIVIIALLKKPYYKWIVNIGIAGIISAFFIAIIGGSATLLFNLVLESMDQNQMISAMPMLITAAIILGISIILIIINAYLDNKTKSHNAIAE